MTAPLSIHLATLNPSEWDHALARCGGHPLQSALWGQARRAVDGIREMHWLAKQGDVVVWMARVEVRRVPGIGHVAWIPRGPTFLPEVDQALLQGLFRQQLREHGFILAVMSPWQAMPDESAGLSLSVERDHARTLWVDLRVGRDRLWQTLDKQWRYGVGRAKRTGVNVMQTDDPEQIDWFFRLCQHISQVKGFNLPASAPLMQWLIRHGQTGPVQAHLFVAEHEGRPGAGALILRCGSSVHYLWGGTDRELSRLRLGEAVQWGVMEWALEEGCHLYDLEGIDPANNAGTYAFKKKMGGMEILLAPRSVWPLSLRGRLLARFL